jgi:hypothetical protein
MTTQTPASTNPQSTRPSRRDELLRAIAEEEAHLAQLEAEQVDSQAGSARFTPSWLRSVWSRIFAFAFPSRSKRQFQERPPRR